MSHSSVNDRGTAAGSRRPYPRSPHPPSQMLQSSALPVESTTPRRGRGSKACTNCARIKCKCIARNDGTGCERCHRLKKTCEPSVVVSTPARTPAVSSQPRKTISRTARLEAKLNDLVDLLQSTQNIPVANAGLRRSIPTRNRRVTSNSNSHSNGNSYNVENDSGAGGNDADDGEGESDVDPGHEESLPAPVAMIEDDDDTSPQSVPTDASTTATLTNALEDDISPHEAEACLRRFCDEMLPLSPFIYIPPEVSARRLNETHPFLSLCIRAAASLSSSQRTRLALLCRRAIVQRIVENGERNLDLLLGLLVFVAWVHLSPKEYFFRNFSKLAAQLALSLAWDLGLTMPPLLEPAAAAERFIPVVHIPGTPDSLWKAERSMEERRAILGVYLVTSVLSQMFRGADGLRWSPYLDRLLAEVEQKSKVAQDAVLVQHVKMQLMINQVRYASVWNHGTAGSSLSRSLGGPANIPAPYVDALQTQLDKDVGVTPGMVPSLDNFSVHCFYHFATLAIHESALSRPPVSASSASPSTARPSQNLWVTPDIRRFEIYQLCLQSVTAWLDRFLIWPLELYLCLPCGMFAQLFYVIVCLHKLTTLRDPAWNTEAVRSVVDLFPTIDRIVDICEKLRAMQAAQSEGASEKRGKSNGDGSIIEADEDDFILLAMRKFLTLKAIWQTEMAVREQELEMEQGSRDIATATSVSSSSLSIPALGPTPVSISTPASTLGTGVATGTTPAAIPSPANTRRGITAQTPASGNGGMGEWFDSYHFEVLNQFQSIPDLVANLSWP